MKVDAVIIGAGPAGSTAALALLQQGRSVALIERAAFPRRKVCGEFMSGTSIAVIDRLGLGDSWRAHAGPQVQRVALFSGATVRAAPMPGSTFGRALGRDVLDALLLDKVRSAGAEIFQPARALAVDRGNTSSFVHLAGPEGEIVLEAPLVIAAHGSWEPGPLPTHLPKINRPDDFLGFKAHFRGASLDRDLMPLLFFPGGYGGIVWADGDRLSLSCCIRRDVLERLRREADGPVSAAEAVHRHLLRSCRGVHDAIGGASLDGPWLAAGPIRPGMRETYGKDIFRIGNTAGESHPIIAEGISMAIQSGWLLASALEGTDIRSPTARGAAAAIYGKAWREQFATRIRVASALAAIAVRPRTASAVGALVTLVPSMLTAGAMLSGKTKAMPQLH